MNLFIAYYFPSMRTWAPASQDNLCVNLTKGNVYRHIIQQNASKSWYNDISLVWITCLAPSGLISDHHVAMKLRVWKYQSFKFHSGAWPLNSDRIPFIKLWAERLDYTPIIPHTWPAKFSKQYSDLATCWTTGFRLPKRRYFLFATTSSKTPFNLLLSNKYRMLYSRG
jgi:hypothetical protein